MLHVLWIIIIGAIFGLIAGVITGRGKAMNWIANIIAGLVGSWLGEMLLGSWGPHIADMAVFPSIIGAIILVLLTSWLLTMFGKNTKKI